MEKIKSDYIQKLRTEVASSMQDGSPRPDPSKGISMVDREFFVRTRSDIAKTVFIGIAFLYFFSALIVAGRLVSTSFTAMLYPLFVLSLFVYIYTSVEQMLRSHGRLARIRYVLAFVLIGLYVVILGISLGLVSLA